MENAGKKFIFNQEAVFEPSKDTHDVCNILGIRIKEQLKGFISLLKRLWNNFRKSSWISCMWIEKYVSK